MTNRSPSLFRPNSSTTDAYFAAWVLHLVGFLLASFLSPSMDVIAPLAAALGIFWIAAKRKTLLSPLLIFAIAQTLYILLPAIVFDQGDIMRFGASFGKGYQLANVALSVTLAVATLLSLIPKPMPKPAGTWAQRETQLVVIKVAIAFSVALSLANIALNGAVLFNDFSYAESFLERRAAGSGIFAFAIQFAMAALGLYYVAHERPSIQITLWIHFPILLLYISTGQRKYLIIPFMFWMANRLRLSMSGMIFALISGVTFYFLNLFLGFLRVNEIPFTFGNLSEDLAYFWANIDKYLDGETGVLNAALSLAAENRVPNLGIWEYVGAPLMMMPQFVFGSIFVPLNERFSAYFTPEFAIIGGGWGFPFFGEAFAVGGLAGLVIISALTTVYFSLLERSISKKGNPYIAAFAITNLYFALWIVRNAFAYILREAGYVAIAMAVSFLVAVLVIEPLKALSALRPRRRRDVM